MPTHRGCATGAAPCVSCAPASVRRVRVRISTSRATPPPLTMRSDRRAGRETRTPWSIARRCVYAHPRSTLRPLHARGTPSACGVDRVCGWTGSGLRPRATVPAACARTRPSTPASGRRRCLARAMWSRQRTRRPLRARSSRCARGTRCTGSPAVVPRRPGGCSSASASPATRRAGSRSDCRRRATAPDRRQSTWTARAAATTSSFEQAWPYGPLGEGEGECARGEHLPRVATTAAGGVTEVAHRSSRDCRGLPCLP